MSIFASLDGFAAYETPAAEQRRLTAEDVAEIRRLYATGQWWQKTLAREFGVSQPQISKIVRGLQWQAGS